MDWITRYVRGDTKTPEARAYGVSGLPTDPYAAAARLLHAGFTAEQVQTVLPRLEPGQLKRVSTRITPNMIATIGLAAHGRTVVEIAGELTMSRQNVYRLLRKQGIQPATTRVAELTARQKQTVLRLFGEGHSYRQIEALTGATRDQIRYLVKVAA